jgi:hypothetical protein
LYGAGLTRRPKSNEAKLKIACDAAEKETTDTLNVLVVDALLPRLQAAEFREVREYLPSGGVLLKSTNAVLSSDIIIDLLRDRLGFRWLRDAEWRRGNGKLVSLLQEKCKESKVRNFIRIITVELGIPKQTAYDWLREYQEFNGKAIQPEKHDDRPNAVVDQITQTIAAERAAREGREIVPPPASVERVEPLKQPESAKVTVSLPKLEVTAEQRQLYYNALGENRPAVCAEFCAAFLRVIAAPAAPARTVTKNDVVAEVVSALRNLGFKKAEVRTIELNPELDFDQLVQVALKQLKPEVNRVDPDA